MTGTKRKAILFLAVSFAFLAAHTADHGNIQKPFVVVIDPGHGGKDPGNLGTGRYKKTEKDISLDVSTKLGNLIKERFPGIKVIYTRSGDTFPTLKERVEIANEQQADLFISIHCNAASPAAFGSETFVMGMHKTEEALKSAMKENASIYLEENYEENYKGFDPKDPETYIILSLRQNIYLDQSLKLSKNIQDQFRERVGRRDRGVKQAGYFVISFTTMPSVLVELGFLTNQEEEDFLNKEEGREYMASALFRAFRDYKAELDGTAGDVQVPEDPKPKGPVNPEPKQEKITQSADNKGDGIIWEDCGENLRFQVQVMTSSKKVEKTQANFKGLLRVEEYLSNGMYKYTAGCTLSYEKAKQNLSKARELGFEGAFVIAFKGKERVELSEAIRLEKK
jgi:N-acetylmuramoyl-L-alanine amidase